MAEGAFLKVGAMEYGAVELPAVAAAIASDVWQRAAEGIVLTIDHLEEDGRALNQLQEIELVKTALQSFDGTEQAVRVALDRDSSITEGVRLVETEGSGA